MISAPGTGSTRRLKAHSGAKAHHESAKTAGEVAQEFYESERRGLDADAFDIRGEHARQCMNILQIFHNGTLLCRIPSWREDLKRALISRPAPFSFADHGRE